MSRRVFLDVFYDQFRQFLEELTRVFPDDSDFPTYTTALALLRKTNPKLVPEQVALHVKPFDAKIRARDESFFMDHSFDEYTQDGGMSMIIHKMKEYWATLSDTNKKVVWDYITLLLDLATKCAA